ncbi:hypothetical protein CAPTEDRAFT_214751 [Capitella teleta]|uniref:Uncharacterized protein n=1 Tax=Capitella teleta TaxID=283909 RepID=R7UBF3_CAPTE|nr:hypothetical protein CAPTEDRAFT_214751 [Capitella teleta]|eukprot:ELU03319.1 hypothetical protein CAPTEDRAFT_214751 [Capitella teleta]
MDVFSMIKHSLLAESSNPVLQHYQLGRQIGTAGPEMVWKIYEAQRLGDQRLSETLQFNHRPGAASFMFFDVSYLPRRILGLQDNERRPCGYEYPASLKVKRVPSKRTQEGPVRSIHIAPKVSVAIREEFVAEIMELCVNSCSLLILTSPESCLLQTHLATTSFPKVFTYLGIEGNRGSQLPLYNV